MVIGEEKEDAASSKGSASVSLAVSRILRDTSSKIHRTAATTASIPSKHLSHLGRCQASIAAAIIVEPSRQLALACLHPYDLFLHGPSGQQTINRHRPRLPDPMRTVSRLRLGSRIPPRIKMNHHIGRSQVQPITAGLEADQKHRRTID